MANVEKRPTNPKTATYVQIIVPHCKKAGNASDLQDAKEYQILTAAPTTIFLPKHSPSACMCPIFQASDHMHDDDDSK